MNEKALKDRLIENNPEFRRVFTLHQECEQELQRFAGKAYLSDSDQRIVRELKKKKLSLKDKMYAIMAAVRKSSSRGDDSK
jgi:uncharacterized protein